MKVLLCMCIVACDALVPDDAAEFNVAESKRMDDAMKERGCGLRLGARRLPDLYFHVAEGRTAHLHKVDVTVPECVAIRNASSDVFAGRMDLAVTVPLLTLAGELVLEDGGRRIGRYPFRLQMRDVRGRGLCFTRWTELRFEIVDCDMRYRREGRVGSRPEGLDERVLAEKTWRGVTTGLTRSIVAELDRVATPFHAHLSAETSMFKKYRDYVAGSVDLANAFVDGVVAALRRFVRDGFAIPNIDESFERKGLFITWRGSFTAERGRLRGLTTVSRLGDAAFASDGSSKAHFFGNLSFERLELRFGRYKARFMSVGPSGRVDATLRPIRLRIHPWFDLVDGRVHLEDLVIDDVGDVNVKVTGLGVVFNWLTSRVVTWVAGLVRDRLLDDLQRLCDAYVRDVLDGYSFAELVAL